MTFSLVGFKLVNVFLSLSYLFLHPLQKPLFFFNQKCIYQLCPIIRKLFVSICEVRNVNDCFSFVLQYPLFLFQLLFCWAFQKTHCLKSLEKTKLVLSTKSMAQRSPLHCSPALSCPGYAVRPGYRTCPQLQNLLAHRLHQFLCMC